jgi:hypothetical protein
MAIVASFVLELGLAGFWYLDRTSKQPPAAPPPLTEEARGYVREQKLKLSEVAVGAQINARQSGAGRDEAVPVAVRQYSRSLESGNAAIGDCGDYV